MKSVSITVASASLLFVLSSCAMQPLSLPGRSTPSDTRQQPAIVERSLDRPAPPVTAEVPGPQPVAPAVAEASGTAPEPMDLLPVSYVNDRIFEYGRKLERWQELDRQAAAISIEKEQAQTMVRCFRDLQKVLNGYQQMRDILLQRNQVVPTPLETEAVFDLQRQDVSFLEGICGRMLGEAHDKDAGWQQRPDDADLNQAETLVERYSANGEYNEVVQVWLKIPPHQIERVDLKTKILYGNALMFLDQPEKAAAIYQQIVEAMSVSKEQPTDLLSLRKVLADLHTAAGNYPAAQQQYTQIAADYQAIGRIEQWAALQLSILERSATGSPELSEYSQLLRSYLGYLPARDGYGIVEQAQRFLEQYPYSPVSSNVDVIRADAQQRAEAWFQGYLSQADALMAEKKFQDAMELLQTVPEQIVGSDRFQAVQKKLDDLVLAEEVDRETAKIQQMQELQRRWNEGMLAADQDDFDTAIGVFTSLLDSEFGTRAADKIKELSLKAAMNERRKAADLFIRFTKTTDLESRKRLLVETRRVLKDILVKYPEVEIADKVLGNIERVEQEMAIIDPLLLPTIEEEERQQALQPATVSEPALDAFDLPVSQPPPTPMTAPAAPATVAPPAPAGQPLPVRSLDQL
ncbi:tetratricopeptide repeat protein [Desulfofustis limnaeus]|uniref:Tetratricopeptide repeat protein n=1 Tax=Desulfofustis limnaeus TaxID=2740163 RepID=A0ABN6M6C7_9BACT|nr:hypothetical protein [Desulfofustis limnaeus]MDX9894429.1 hypothetical protein [Desulfofustis sp.]BDD87775.1 hypothetical protein DPPLL_21400 [Desulfofustis limnaeus]